MSEPLLGEQGARPPTTGAYVAALLEVFMLARFAAGHDVAGALAWLAYFRFSALRALLF